MADEGRRDWSREEVAATVASYLAMLRQEYAGQAYSKTAHRRALLERLQRRTEASVEMKYRNISQVLMEMSFLPIRGYKPLANYQGVLVEEVLAQVQTDEGLDQAAAASVSLDAVKPMVLDFQDRVVEAPKPTKRVADPAVISRFTAVRRDYIEREARNRSLGLAGELFVLDYEARRLHSIGRKKLSDRVEHVSRTKGDGLGYDILSFEESGKESFIEVKTTSSSSLTPFFISANELRFSKQFDEQFRLARVFDFRDLPKMYFVNGSVDAAFILDPVTYRATR
ncbi:MAG: DUF3883 domain-containing protein [Arenimonas sp.]|nr:DUF3883 domain-containing protein [Arenimonas sp.]